MDWTWYLFRFDGRINRAKLWQALLIILCWMIFLGGLAVGAGLLRGTSISVDFNIDDLFRIVDPATYRSLSSVSLSTLIVNLIGTPVFLWVYFATSIKRLHDRDRSGWWMVPFFVLPGLYHQFEGRLPNSYWMLPFALTAAVLYVWGFIEMYCLKGTSWPNRFGPNPLGKQQSRPRSERGRASGWDQDREIELAPHRASPPAAMHVKRGT